MLDPEYLDRAGDMVGAVYGEIESDMLAYLCGLLLQQDLAELGQRGSTALNLLSQSAGPALMAFVEAHREDVSRAVAETVEDAVRRSDRADAARLGAGAAEAMAATRPRQVGLTARGIAAILERDNVDMARGALDLWNRTVARAVTRVNTGEATADRAAREAVREMMRRGVSTVTYRDAETGRQTITNRVDVAVRRHVRTQLAQDGMRRTLDVCGQAGIRLVEVSSHGGARPEHARWQGRVYSLDGTVEVGGKTYKDFYAETGYGKVDGLGGANCRHSFGPWIPGTPRKYDPEPSHPSGLDSDEIYSLRQGQRRRERDIRQTKRELAGAQLIADRDASLANVAEVERLKTRLARQQAGMRAYIEDANGRGDADVLQRSPNREWAGDMPRIRKSDASRRTMDEFMGGDGVRRTLRARGVSKTAARRALSEEMTRRGVSSRDFSMLSRTNQQAVFRAAIDSGAIRGIETSKSARKRAEAHAKRYYEELVNRDRASTISKIADASSMSIEDATRAFNHLFIEEHDLASGRMKFPPDYYMAQSMQRLIDTGAPFEHDTILFKHENLEAVLMADGMPYEEAHELANKTYNYEELLIKWIDEKGPDS